LALVSKRWAAVAARHFQIDGAELVYEIACCEDSPLDALDREVERLEGLAAWLQQNGHLLEHLVVGQQYDNMINRIVSGSDEAADDEEETFRQETAQVMPYILHALAAAGQRHGSLRLQQLWLPVLGGTSILTLCRALSACKQLRGLVLENSCSSQTTTTSKWSVGKLPAVFQQLTQLTSLMQGY
jgi:hypothetical protein